MKNFPNVSAPMAAVFATALHDKWHGVTIGSAAPYLQDVPPEELSFRAALDAIGASQHETSTLVDAYDHGDLATKQFVISALERGGPGSVQALPRILEFLGTNPNRVGRISALNALAALDLAISAPEARLVAESLSMFLSEPLASPEWPYLVVGTESAIRVLSKSRFEPSVQHALIDSLRSPLAWYLRKISASKLLADVATLSPGERRCVHDTFALPVELPLEAIHDLNDKTGSLDNNVGNEIGDFSDENSRVLPPSCLAPEPPERCDELCSLSRGVTAWVRSLMEQM